MFMIFNSFTKTRRRVSEEKELQEVNELLRCFVNLKRKKTVNTNIVFIICYHLKRGSPTVLIF